jgi:predicted nucleic acid-binding protein
LDVCSLNRPFDDETQERVRLEAEAVKTVLLFAGLGELVAVGSGAIEFEVDRMVDADRHAQVSLMLRCFDEYVLVEETERQRGKVLEGLGFGQMDALHLACAEKAHADVLLTTDDGLLKTATRQARLLKVRVANPLAWIGEVVRR